MSEDMQATVGDYVSLQRGTTYKSKLLDLPGPVLLGLASIQLNGGFRTDSLRTYGGESPEKLILKPGELYVSLKDVTQSANLLGAVSRVPKGICEGRLTQDTVKLIFKNKKIPNNYLYWLLRTPQYRHYCWERSIGTTNLSLSREDFLSFPVPPLTREKNIILNLLEALDDKIELNQQMNHTLEAIARALFKSWFIDFDPVRAKMEGRQPAGMDAETAALFPAEFEDSPLGKIPKGWRVGTLENVIEVNSRSITKNYPYQVIQYVDISSVTVGRLEGATVYELSDAPSRAKRLVQHGDTIWSGVRPNRKSYLFIHTPPKNLVVSTGFIVLSPKAIPPSYLYAWVTTDEFVDYLAFNADGSAYPAVRPDRFSDAQILIPWKAILNRFEQQVSFIRDKIIQNERESIVLASIRDTFLPKLLSGKICIKDAEKVVEEVL